MSSRVAARATCDTPLRYCVSEADTRGQLPLVSGLSDPSQATRVDPFAPACPSCTAILACVLSCTKSTMRFHAAVCSGV
ncbi:Uncharacterised protein [Mycobacteroides abscessus subsp. abscessus]|nr:Uncharacterised protein [Mycobacteroides abscessus subsp. abscessus]